MRYLVMLITMFWLQNAVAFNFQNHRVICHMAYKQLSLEAQHSIDQVVGDRFQSFAQACAWPDQIRKQARYEHTKYWHYINVPRNTVTVTRQHCPTRGCLFTGIEQSQKKLLKNNADLESLLFLSHFIGDLHQPMHVSYADDRGGNHVRLIHKGKPTNLHALWDGALFKRTPWYNHSEALMQRVTPLEVEQWQQGSLEDWATETLVLTQDAYRLLGKSNGVSSGYVEHFVPQLEQKMMQASVRLAQILEDLYGAH